ncbi:hypothetical protein DFP72DRAFT_1050130 [Ephemerocybe angulata]|uniref:Uncharacterized protein n=1 Tax=Ephemerocybe angulata TaxID=980116 RepID=A0A8H6M030_9AGAR|nr:hypothetical protein DFP72DRAFT_1050130 [Tulosesus angulatus]
MRPPWRLQRGFKTFLTDHGTTPDIRFLMPAEPPREGVLGYSYETFEPALVLGSLISTGYFGQNTPVRIETGGEKWSAEEQTAGHWAGRVTAGVLALVVIWHQRRSKRPNPSRAFLPSSPHRTMAHPPASAKKRKRTPTAWAIPKPTTTTRTAAPTVMATLTTAHFARLTAIWELDHRIPSSASRAAWAAARGLDAAKKLGIEIPEGRYEMEVGDVEAEEEEERKAREAREEKATARRMRVRVKKEVGEVEMRRRERRRERKRKAGEQDTSPPSLGPHLHPILHPRCPHHRPTLSQYFLPPSSPYPSPPPPPLSAPSPPASPPIDLPRPRSVCIFTHFGVCTGVRVDQADRPLSMMTGSFDGHLAPGLLPPNCSLNLKRGLRFRTPSSPYPFPKPQICLLKSAGGRKEGEGEDSETRSPAGRLRRPTTMAHRSQDLRPTKRSRKRRAADLPPTSAPESCCTGSIPQVSSPS